MEEQEQPFDQTQEFIPEYAQESAREEQAPEQQQEQYGLTDELDENGESAFSPTQRFQLEHAAAEEEGEEQEQEQEQTYWEEAKQQQDQSELVQASQLKPQDYIPKKLVGYTYGTEHPWQMKHAPNPILENNVFLRIGTNSIFSCRPSIVKFAGYAVGKKYTQQVSIVNVSSTSQRVHIFSPAPTSGFTIKYTKKGSVAPGMSEDITITFEPTKWKYYEDCIKVHCLGENLVIPIHGYPIVNARNHIFPSQIDMGRCCVGSRVSKRIELVCDIPMEFEYQFTVLNPSLDFTIFPLHGIIPANGSAWLTIDYTPKRAVTSNTALRVNLAQFGFEPFVCTIIGVAEIEQLNLPVVDLVHAKKMKEAAKIRAKKALAMNQYSVRIKEMGLLQHKSPKKKLNSTQ